MPLINEVKIIPCSFRHIIPVRFALCTHTDCTIPDNVLKSFKPGANLPEVNHAYTLRALDSGYVFATWSSNPTEENIAVFAAKGGRLTMLDGPRSTGFASRLDTIAVPREVSQLYMLFIRIPESDEEFPTDRDKHVWKEMRKNLAADPYGQMQLVTLGKAVNPGLRQYSYEESTTCFHVDDLPRHVEEYAEEPGGLLRLRQENVGVNLFEERKPAESKEWSPQELCGRLSPWKRWDASATSFHGGKRVPPTMHHDTHVACLADPVGMIYDMVTVYSAGLEDMSLYARWHEPMIVSGELTRMFNRLQEQKQKSVPSAVSRGLAKYNEFKVVLERAEHSMFDRLKLIVESWKALMQDTTPIYSFQFQLKNFFMSEDQQHPSPVDPATAFESDEVPADPLTVARLAILAGAFLNIASKSQSFAALDSLFAQGTPFLGLFERVGGEGAIPGNEYGLILTNLTTYLVERAKKKETVQGVIPLITAFNKRLGLLAAEPSNTLGHGISLALTLANAELAPLAGTEEIRGDSEVEQAVGILSTSVEALSVPVEAFLAKELVKLNEAKANFDEKRQLQRDAQLKVDQSQRQLEDSRRAYDKSRKKLSNALENRNAARRVGARNIYALEDAVFEVEAELATAKKNTEWAVSQDMEVRRNPLGTGASMTDISIEYEAARIEFDGQRVLFMQKYRAHCGDLDLSVSARELRVADMGEVLGLQTQLDDLRKDLVQAKTDEAAEKLEKVLQADRDKRYLSWRQDFAQCVARRVKASDTRIDMLKAEMTFQHAENRHHFATRLGRAVSALDGTLSAANLITAIYRLSKELQSARKDPAPFVRDILSVAADGLALMEMAFATRVARSTRPMLTKLYSITRLATPLARIVDVVDVCRLAKARDYDSALMTAFGGLLVLRLVLLARLLPAATTGIGLAVFVLAAGTVLVSTYLQDQNLETAAKNNYWTTDACKVLNPYPIHNLKSPFAVDEWYDFFKQTHEKMTTLFNPQISVEINDKRLRIITRCFRQAMIGPASAGVGVCAPRLFGHGPMLNLDGGQLAQEPAEQEKDGMLESVLEFDVNKILLQAKDILGAPVVNPYDRGKVQYSIQPSAAVFHMYSADMDLFAKSENVLTVTLSRDLTEPDFSEKDIVGIAL